MGEVSQCLGRGVSVIVKADDGTEKEWKLSSVKGGIKGDFEAWLEGQIRRAAIADKDVLPPDDYTAQLAKVSRDIRVQKRYSWGHPGWRESVMEGPGFIKLTHLLLQEHHPEVRDWSIEQVDELVSQDAEGFAMAILGLIGDADPKLKAAPTPPK